MTLASPVHSDRSMTAYPGSNAVMTKCQHQEQQQQQQQKRPSDCSSAMGLNRILQHSPMPPPPRKPASTSSRYHLYIRQQPIAARACGAGDRDRRPVDPPPIIQMLMTDFDSMWDLHLDILQDPRFTVGCFLFPVMPAAWSSSSESTSWENRAEENAPGFSTPLLSGKAFVSPFYVDADPDPNTAPEHPSSGWPPNPNLNLPRLRPPTPEDKKRPPRIPSTFFIFSDLSVRTAGLYRLQFRLMNWGHVEDTGQSMPILAEAWSDPFRVYPAKDFPGMRDSSRLAEGLKELGFVELKTRGKGKGKGRKR